MKTRRTTVELIYEGTDITKDISGDFKAFDFTDNESGQADDISVTLKNDHGLWSGPWFPAKGDSIRATIIDDNGQTKERLYCGKFKVDDLTSSGPESSFVMKAASIPLDETIRREDKSKAWENIKLSAIVKEIASMGGLQPIYDVDHDPQYDRIDQREESDLAFLERICEDEGFSLKVTDDQLVIFAQQKYEARAPVATLTRGKSNVISWDLDSQAYDLYSECTCSYYDPATENLLSRTVKAPNVNQGMKKKLLKRAANLAEAERYATNELRNLNKNEVNGRITVKGAVKYIGGVTIMLSGFGVFDGKYMIESAKHSVSGGYTGTLNIRRVLEGY